jgi:hypothetical protein
MFCEVRVADRASEGARPVARTSCICQDLSGDGDSAAFRHLYHPSQLFPLLYLSSWMLTVRLFS